MIGEVDFQPEGLLCQTFVKSVNCVNWLIMINHVNRHQSIFSSFLGNKHNIEAFKINFVFGFVMNKH